MTQHDLRVLPAPFQRERRHLFSYDAGYQQGVADTSARYEVEVAALMWRAGIRTAWLLVLVFLVGGLLGVAACAYVWPLVAAGWLP